MRKGPDHADIGQLVHQLVEAKRTPVRGICGAMLLALGMVPLDPVDVVVGNPLNSAENNGKTQWRATDLERAKGQDRMQKSMFRPSEMDISAARRQHARGLQKEICKHVFGLQKDQ